MQHRTTKEAHHPNPRSLCAAGAECIPLEAGGVLPARNLPIPNHHRNPRCGLRDRLAYLQAFSGFGKMVEKARRWAMRHHCIEHIIWNEVVWQRPFELEAVWNVLTHLACHNPRGAVVWEVRGNQNGVRYLLGADQAYIEKIKDIFHAHGNVQFHEIPKESRRSVSVARQLKITHPTLSLNTTLTQSTIRAGLAAMSTKKPDTDIILQLVCGRGFSPSLIPTELGDPTASWFNIIAGSVPKATAEARKSVKEKAEQQGFQVTIRIGTTGHTTSELRSLLSAFRILASAGVRIRDEAENPDKLNSAHVPWHFPNRLSCKELVGFLLLPAGEEELPGTPGLHPKLLLPPPWYHSPTSCQNDRSFAISTEAVNPKKLSVSSRDSLEHLHLIGPTGSGKSTAMLHLILADIRANRSILVIDPKADLICFLLARIPEERADDVVVIDPSDDRPCGFNPLAFKRYKNKALIADAILAVLRELWRDNWGVRVQDILSAALLTLAEIEGATLLWLQPLLTDVGFRKKIVGQVKGQIGLMSFWNEFEALSDLQKQQWTAPVSNKLRQFTLRPSLRGVLGQAHPKFDLTDLFYERKIILVPLNKGLIGSEASRLIGSLVVGLTWTLALSRASLPPERRHPVEIYVDEFQDYLALASDFNDALAQARGLGVGFTLAHQFRDQLPPEVRAGVDANCRNKIAFGLSVKDAKDMSAMAPELVAEDFMKLPRYQIYTSFQYGGRDTGWIQGKTLPPPPTIRDPVELHARSITRYGIPAEEVEKDYLAMFSSATTEEESNNTSPIGRRKRP